MDIYDQQWTLQETFDVTRVSDQYNAQRSWLQILGDTLYVSYNLGRELRGVLDLQCVMSAFGKRRSPPEHLAGSHAVYMSVTSARYRRHTATR